MATKLFAVLLSVVAWTTAVEAQQATFNTPFDSQRGGYFEQMGTSWGLSGPNWTFNFGGGAGGTAFGNPNPSAGIGYGYGTGGAPIGTHFNWSMSQGTSAGFGSQSGSVTSLNGYPAAIYDTSLTPFVIGNVPFVGMGAWMTNPMLPTQSTLPWQTALQRRALEGTTFIPSGNDPDNPIPFAAPRNEPVLRNQIIDHGEPELNPNSAPNPRGDDGAATRAKVEAPTSIAELRRQREAKQQQMDAEIQELLAHAQSAERDGKIAVAKNYYQRAMRRADGTLKADIARQLKRFDRVGGARVIETGNGNEASK